MAKFKIPALEKEERIEKNTESDVYVPITKFAELAGISRQAVYKQVDNRLSTYCKLVDNQKMVNLRALSDVFGAQVDKVDNQIVNQVDKVDNQIVNLDKGDLSAVVAVLQETINTLQGQLAEKDKQLYEKDRQISDLHRRLEDLTVTLMAAQRLAESAQALHAGTIQQQLASEKNTMEQSEPEMTPKKKKRWWNKE